MILTDNNNECECNIIVNNVAFTFIMPIFAESICYGFRFIDNSKFETTNQKKFPFSIIYNFFIN